MKVVHQRYVAYSDAHYAGDLVDGAFSVTFPIVATRARGTGVVPADLVKEKR